MAITKSARERSAKKEREERAREKQQKPASLAASSLSDRTTDKEKSLGNGAAAKSEASSNVNAGIKRKSEDDAKVGQFTIKKLALGEGKIPAVPSSLNSKTGLSTGNSKNAATPTAEKKLTTSAASSTSANGSNAPAKPKATTSGFFKSLQGTRPAIVKAPTKFVNSPPLWLPRVKPSVSGQRPAVINMSRDLTGLLKRSPPPTLNPPLVHSLVFSTSLFASKRRALLDSDLILIQRNVRPMKTKTAPTRRSERRRLSGGRPGRILLKSRLSSGLSQRGNTTEAAVDMKIMNMEMPGILMLKRVGKRWLPSRTETSWKTRRTCLIGTSHYVSDDITSWVGFRF